MSKISMLNAGTQLHPSSPLSQYSFAARIVDVCRFILHFSFMINTREVNGKALPEELILRVFNHAHDFYGAGLRMFFMAIPAFAWIFTHWSLLAVTPLYLCLIHSESVGCVECS